MFKKNFRLKISRKVSILLYFVALALIWIIHNFNLIESGRFNKLFNNHYAEKIFSFLLKYTGYRGLLLSDLENYLKVGHWRCQWSKQNNSWNNSKKFQKKDTLKIGFLGIFGQEANYPKEFFNNHPEKFEVYIYDIIREDHLRGSPYQGTTVFNNKENVFYKKTPYLAPYDTPHPGQKELAKIIEEDNLDVFVFSSHTFTMTLLDLITTPILISINVTSLPTPHLKSSLQSFTQPPWPYEVRDKKIFNLKKGKPIPHLTVSDQAMIYNYRAAKFFKKIEYSQRKKQIYFAGALIKINSGEFSKVLLKLLQTEPELKLIYRGRGDVESVRETFSKAGVLERTEYRGLYYQKIDENGNFSLSEELKSAYTDLAESSIFLNTFPYHGSRASIESYVLDVPVIHLDSKGESWLDMQDLVPYRSPLNHPSISTAYNLNDYLSLSKKVLNDSSFANEVIQAQQKILEKMCDPMRFWNVLEQMIDWHQNKDS